MKDPIRTLLADYGEREVREAIEMWSRYGFHSWRSSIQPHDFGSLVAEGEMVERIESNRRCGVIHHRVTDFDGI